jgi:hypothetical protein
MQTKNDVIEGAGQWAKMMSPGGKLAAPMCHTTKKINNVPISIGLSVFRFIANEYKRIAIRLLLTIRNIRSTIW